MAPTAIQRLTFATLALLCLAGPARALQIGETKAQILARHGTPGSEDAEKKFSMYFWNGWSAQLDFAGDVVERITYRRGQYLQDSEIDGLLHSNGGLARWRKVNASGTAPRKWVRDDAAVATCASGKALIMTFEMHPALPVMPLAPKLAPINVVPPEPAAPAPPAPPTEPASMIIHPKLLGSPAVTEPPLELNDSPLAEAPRPAPLRPLPKLPVAELLPEPAPELVAEPAPAVEAQVAVTAPAAVAPDAPVASLAPIRASATEVRAAAPASSSSGWYAGGLLLLGAAAGGSYFFKHRTGGKSGGQRSTKTRVPERKVPEPPAATTSALDRLRPDQVELLVGEIFRRDGYTVELSAAAAQGDSIDLTLRRDTETILVQCKHWRTARVTAHEVREFYHQMTTNGAPRGFFVTAGHFARDAREFAESQGIDLMDRAALEAAAAAIARPGEDFCGVTDWVEEFGAHARIFDPECPICSGTMSIRHNRVNGAAYWGCLNQPRCPGRREPRHDLLLAPAPAGF